MNHTIWEILSVWSLKVILDLSIVSFFVYLARDKV